MCVDRPPAKTPSKPTKLYRHFDKHGRLLYVGISLSAINRLRQHHQQAHWEAKIARVEVEPFKTREDALNAEAWAIELERPLYNIVRPQPKGEPPEPPSSPSRPPEPKLRLVPTERQIKAMWSDQSLTEAFQKKLWRASLG